MRTAYILLGIALVASAILFLEAVFSAKEMTADFQGYSTQTIDLLKDLEGEKK